MSTEQTTTGISTSAGTPATTTTTITPTTLEQKPIVRNTPSKVLLQPAQGNITESPINTNEVVYRLTFSSDTIKRLTLDDFNIDSKELVTLKHPDCILILFYVENSESYQLANIWALAAQQVAGPIFAAINVLSERKVATAFTKLKSDGSNPLHWASIRQFPFIMVYRNGWPVAFYNGAREVQAIIDYSLTLACQAGYYEIEQYGGSMQAEARLEMGPYDLYRNTDTNPNKIRNSSIQYTAQSPIRGFNSTLPLVITGSSEASASAKVIQKEAETQEARRKTGESEASLTETIENVPTGTQGIVLPA